MGLRFLSRLPSSFESIAEKLKASRGPEPELCIRLINICGPDMMLFLVPRKEGVGVGGRKGGRETDRQGGTDRQTGGGVPFP